MFYLEMTASQEQMMETRRQIEHNRLEAMLAQARLSHEADVQKTLPYMSRFTHTAWQMERWQGAGW